ncbi:LysR family transcriptional regulator [uncultured Cellulomonas sp.]|uniref:LysR family transcriptional regulator n=1 Tax=uncultured Cellulomonas sp. TaxID=189682 RepID=UPI0028E5DFA7|nr:LysR family transcriptional regulator [uncultured Cellulomonas sp.]
MDLRLLRSFVAIADVGSITRAAHQVGYTQPAVSQHLAALERHVGEVLFERTPGGMRLTSSGRRIYRYACGIVALADAMAASSPSGAHPDRPTAR